MNPILLKPTNDTGSQVIINGKPIGVMSAVEYYRHKRDYIPYILEAYRELEKKYDVIVIEGAGSPAEINLKKDDIVNMGMAELVDAPVLLVGDIDRGGVFAQIAGTVMLLEEKERKRIAGTVINKFRGDVSILEPGLKMLEDRTDIPVLGVVPYLYLDLDEEDENSSLQWKWRGGFRYLRRLSDARQGNTGSGRNRRKRHSTGIGVTSGLHCIWTGKEKNESRREIPGYGRYSERTARNPV